MKTLFITTARPWENNSIESLNVMFRDGLLNGHFFDTLLGAKVLNERWRIAYNTICPHSCLGYRLPDRKTIRPRLQAAAPKLPTKLFLKERELQTLN